MFGSAKDVHVSACGGTRQILVNEDERSGPQASAAAVDEGRPVVACVAKPSQVLPEPFAERYQRVGGRVGECWPVEEVVVPHHPRLASFADEQPPDLR